MDNVHGVLEGDKSKVLKITNCSNPDYWYFNRIGQMFTYYTIENGNALIRSGVVFPDQACYVFDGDYELGTMELTYDFVSYGS